jgi:hypothetical protein
MPATCTTPLVCCVIAQAGVATSTAVTSPAAFFIQASLYIIRFNATCFSEVQRAEEQPQQ